MGRERAEVNDVNMSGTLPSPAPGATARRTHPFVAAAYVVAGVLVGVGTRLGKGCTSGHGLCGIARLSRRSIVATCIFMTTGALTVFIVRHLLHLAQGAS